MNPKAQETTGFLRVDAAGAADGLGGFWGPVSVLLRLAETSGFTVPSVTLEAIGSPQEVSSHPSAASAHLEQRSRSILIPALVNAHAHLDLTGIGPRPFDPRAGFSGFVDLVRKERPVEPAGICGSVLQGALFSQAGGVVATGDIAGAPQGAPCQQAWIELASSRLSGISFLEFFAIGRGEQRARGRVRDLLRGVFDGRGTWERCEHPNPGPCRLGLQPHAPTTVSLSTFRWSVELAKLGDLPLSTHLAETPQEHEFIAHGRGPQREFLESLGLWEDRMLEEIGHGRTPVEHMAGVLSERPFLCAHVNDASDSDIALLSRTPTSIAYCPRASDYFGAHEHFGPHRYRDMLAAGINVCLGTDSIINLPPGTDRLSTLDEMRFLYQRDKTDPVTLLRMGTVNGAKALGLREEAFAFKVGSPLAGLVAVPFEPVAGLTPLGAALSSGSAPELLLIGK